MVNTYVTVLIAIIAGTFSLLGLVISKEQKVSEFRQAWIDALRNDIAEMIGQACLIHAELLKLAEEDPRDTRAYLKRTRQSYIDANRAITRIKLRLNKTEKESDNLLRSIDSLESLLGRSPSDSFDSEDEIYPINREIESNASIVLKGEWKRVKRGEPPYRIAEYFAVTVLIATIIFACVALLGPRN